MDMWRNENVKWRKCILNPYSWTVNTELANTILVEQRQPKTNSRNRCKFDGENAFEREYRLHQTKSTFIFSFQSEIMLSISAYTIVGPDNTCNWNGSKFIGRRRVIVRPTSILNVCAWSYWSMSISREAEQHRKQCHQRLTRRVICVRTSQPTTRGAEGWGRRGARVNG